MTVPKHPETANKLTKYAVVIVGGGHGSRMGTTTPKQFLLLNQKPILMHTIEAFYHSDLKPYIILVLNIDFHPYWKQLCKQYHFTIPHQLVKGGNERFHSVQKGLAMVKDDTIVAIHDAARPLISNQLITNSFLQAQLHDAVVAATQSTDSVRQAIDHDMSKAVDRNTIYLVQTPQTFKSALLKKAYQQAFQLDFTDDASVVEKYGTPIKLIPGERTNIKITYPQDILLAEAYLSAH